MVHHRSIVSTQWHRDSTRTSLNIKIESIHTSITERTRPTPGGRRWPESSVQKVSKCDSRVVAGYENACRSATEREQDPLPLRLAVCDVFPDLRARSEELSGLVLRVDVVPSTSIAEVCSWVAICSILVREHIYKCDRDDIDGRVGAKASEGFLAGALTLQTASDIVPNHLQRMCLPSKPQGSDRKKLSPHQKHEQQKREWMPKWRTKTRMNA